MRHEVVVGDDAQRVVRKVHQLHPVGQSGRQRTEVRMCAVNMHCGDGTSASVAARTHWRTVWVRGRGGARPGNQAQNHSDYAPPHRLITGTPHSGFRPARNSRENVCSREPLRHGNVVHSRRLSSHSRFTENTTAKVFSSAADVRSSRTCSSSLRPIYSHWCINRCFWSWLFLRGIRSFPIIVSGVQNPGSPYGFLLSWCWSCLIEHCYLTASQLE